MMEKTVTLAYLPGFGFDFVLHKLIGAHRATSVAMKSHSSQVSNEVA